MAEITATLVKELRERTGAGMMECKKALVTAQGDIEQAIEDMRKSGQAKAVKKAGRVAAEGRVEIVNAHGRALLLEVNCETDFTSQNEGFKVFVREIAESAHAKAIDDVAHMAELKLASGASVEETRLTLVSKIGENMAVRRAKIIDGKDCHIGSYVHSGRIGVVVKLKGGSTDLAKDIAMHVAASNPVVIRPEEVSETLIQKEREIFMAQSLESGKSPDIVEKMIDGRIRKFLEEICLTGQPFVKDPTQKVSAVLKAHHAEVIEFIRFEVGEGIEKEETDFALEVMAQVRGN